MNKRKIFNDPVYGFISINHEILFDLIEHPLFQRLRRIRQVGLTHLIYPGANHTRFHHALGAMHLVGLAIRVLRSKGVSISIDEEVATLIAILLHDIGHGPYSHALEHELVDCHHEELTLAFIEQLNTQFEGKLTLALEIFRGDYQKSFLHQLISSQLDMDRMDYLARDSFYSGVVEGTIGYDRIIKMLDVADDRLVVEAKGIHSVESFLVARKIMYWQVYLHKAVLAAESMLIRAMQRIKELHHAGTLEAVLPAELQSLYSLSWFNEDERGQILHSFAQLDDYDIIVFLKKFVHCSDLLLRTLANGLIHRKLFTVDFSNSPFDSDMINLICGRIVRGMNVDEVSAQNWLIQGQEKVTFYDPNKDPIKLLQRDGQVVDLSDFAHDLNLDGPVVKHYLCYPKGLKEI